MEGKLSVICSSLRGGKGMASSRHFILRMDFSFEEESTGSKGRDYNARKVSPCRMASKSLKLASMVNLYLEAGPNEAGNLQHTWINRDFLVKPKHPAFSSSSRTRREGLRRDDFIVRQLLRSRLLRERWCQ